MALNLTSIRQAEALPNPWFADEFLTVIWRLWGKIPAEKLAQVLEGTCGQIQESARLLGLDPRRQADPRWRKRGYATILRSVWHLLTIEQICCLLDMSERELETLLREDDFMWTKLGHLKPQTPGARYRELTAEERQRTETLVHTCSGYEKRIGNAPDRAFDFLDRYSEPDPELILEINRDSENLRFIYSYFALYGDPLLDEELDPFPEGLLQQYARYGINGVWLQGVLYQLVPFPFAPELSEGWEVRLKNLRKLVQRAARYGIGVYLYLNEPRAMPERVFETWPQLRGHAGSRKGDYSLCTSTPEVQNYLEEAACRIFTEAEGLAGFFTITASENQTNCYYDSDKTTCPRCGKRDRTEVLAEVNNLLFRGARRGNPKARGIAWVWGWPDDRVEEVIAKLDDGIIFQSTSETHLPICKGGVEADVVDYTMSNPGPSDWAKANWRAATRHGHECCAKVQFNTTWENCNIPFIPCFSLVAEHIRNLNREGVQHLMLSWTLGGAPSPTMKLAADMLAGKYPVGQEAEAFIRDFYPEAEADAIVEAEKIFSESFRQFPFHVGVAYSAPQSSGPKSFFYPEPTGYRASMVGFPYDDLEGWRAVYPEAVFEAQMDKVVSGWERALAVLEGSGKSPQFRELYDCMEGCYVHYLTALNLTRFVRARDRGDQAAMLAALDREEENVIRTIRLCARDSRIGFEATNQYAFSRADLMEKLLNIADCREKIR